MTCNAYHLIISKCWQVELQPSVAQQDEYVMNLNTQIQMVKDSFLPPSQCILEPLKKPTYFNTHF